MREWGLLDRDRRQERQSRDPVGWDRLHIGTDEAAATTAFSPAIRSRDRIVRGCSSAWELPPGCRPCLQRCVVTGLQTSLGPSAPRFYRTASAILCTKSFPG